MTYGVALCVLVLVTLVHPTTAQWSRMPAECRGRCWETDNEHPLARCAPGVLDDVVTKAQADVLVASAETYARRYGWTTTRHVQYPTTDLPTKVLPQEAQGIMESVWRKVQADVRTRCRVGVGDKLTINDAFLVKYAPNGQSGLRRHRDGSFASFNLALSTPDKDFEGGGTLVWDDNEIAKNATYYWNAAAARAGERKKEKKKNVLMPNNYEPRVDELLQEHAVLYRIQNTQMLVSGGYHAHEGVAVTKGTRYIVAGFVGMNANCCSLKYAGWRGVTGVLRVFLLGADLTQRDKLPLHDWQLYDEFVGWVWGWVFKAPIILGLVAFAWRSKKTGLFWKIFARWRRAKRKRSLLPSKSND